MDANNHVNSTNLTKDVKMVEHDVISNFKYKLGKSFSANEYALAKGLEERFYGLETYINNFFCNFEKLENKTNKSSCHFMPKYLQYSLKVLISN